MKNLWKRTVSLDLTPYAGIGQWSSGVLVCEGLYRFVITNHPHLDAWKYVVAAVLLGLSLLELAIVAKVRRDQHKDPFSSLLEVGAIQLQATCALGSAFCAWTGIWSLVFCFCGISLFCGISHLTRAQHRQGSTLLLPLAGNGESRNESLTRPNWMYLIIAGNEIGIRLYKERPGSLEETPMGRILVAYRESQFCILTWPEGVFIDDDPDSPAMLVVNVTRSEPPQAADGTNEHETGEQR